MITGFSYLRASSIKEAISGLSQGSARMHAGGTDLLGCLRDQVFSTEMVVSISGLKELKGIRETPEGHLRIGSLTTITEISESRIIRERYPALAQAAAEVASPQLRNQGTLGGNLCQKPRCWYYRGEFHCLRKGETGAMPLRVRTITIASSAATGATLSIPLTPRLPSSPTRQQSISQVLRVSGKS